MSSRVTTAQTKNIPPDKILGGLTHNSNITKTHSITLGGSAKKKQHKNPLDYTRGLGKKKQHKNPLDYTRGLDERKYHTSPLDYTRGL